MNSTAGHEGSISRDVVRVAAIGDVHCKLDSKGRLRRFFDRIASEADVLLICGDITHFGLTEEASVYNVSVAVLKHHFPDRPPYFVLEVPVNG